MNERTGLEIAIIGMAGRFPKAADIGQFWQNLRAGVEGVSFFADEELAATGIPASLLANPGYVKAGAVVDDIELFDADFFGISAREAEILDPQHRLLLECAWEALEKAGHAGTRRAVGVFVGSAQNSYVLNNLLLNPELLASQGHMAISLANEKDFLASRLSYKLGLVGPSVAVQTACSTSLTAVHLACQSLLVGESELALAGGISVRALQKSGYLYQPDSTSSPDGRCRAFDAAARGTVSGQGFGLVVLRLLEEALAHGDHIHAVIKGSAANNDGSLRIGFTAPSRDGQARVIAAAQMRAEVEADSIGYVEAHGTATPLGDPIEVAALTQAFRETTDRRGFCALGSVKTGIGHLDAAAGIASLIKTTLALEHREIPPSLHFETPNPEIDFASSPFYVVTRPTPWPVNGVPRRAGVSSFGLGGTNVHVILEEAPPPPPSGSSRAGQILILSARTPESLERATDDLAAWLEGHPGESLADVAHTLQVGRVPFRHRRALVASDPTDAAALGARDPRRVWTAEVDPGERRVAFLLPGVGDHYPGMSEGLYRTEPVFREELDRCAELLRSHLGLDLREALFAGTERPQGEGLDLRALLGRGPKEAEPGPLHETRIAQPAVMAVSWALAQLWMSWGVRPQALLGYSLGEYTAACLAGVMSLEDGLALVARRARLIDSLPPGAMLAVPLAEADVLPRLGSGLSLAAENGPAMSVVAGPVEAVDELAERLAAEGLSCRRLPTTHAFHSAMMEPVRKALAELVAGLHLAPPTIPYLSNVTGTWITPEQATDPLYWAGHLCRPVRFGRALETLWAQPRRVLLEVGPGQGLSTLALQHPAQRGGTTLASLRHAQDRQPDDLFLLGALARLWLAGVPVDWDGFSAGEERRRVPLPTYPFERRRYWIDPPRRNGAPAAQWQAPPPTEEDRIPEAVPASPLPARHERPRLLNPYVPPETSEQQRLAALWQELLGVAPIGLHDNFFELGGHSLLGTQMMARLRAELGVEIPLSTLFESPTVADLAGALSQPATGVVRPPLRPRPAGLSPLPLSFAQQRLWFLDQLEPGNPFYNIPNAHRLAGPFSPTASRRALGEIVRRHESLRTVFPAVDGAPTQVILPELGIDIPVEDLSALPKPLRRRHALQRAREEGRRIFDLACGPLLRVRALRLGDEEHVLLLTMHHIISDGWSFQVLLNELVSLYAAFAAGRPSPLPELPVQYADYALWQRQWFAEGALAEQLAWWRDHLAGAPPALEMPTDRPYPPVQTFDGETRWVIIPPETTAALSRVALAAGTSSFMVLTAAFNTLLHRTSGQDDIVVGTPIANRTQKETEVLIGVFVNTLALRTELSGDPSFHELLSRVRRATLGAYDHQDLPFDRLVEELQPERSLSRPPLFQVVFQLLNQPVQIEAPGSFAARPFEAKTDIALFDLTLSLYESGDRISGSLQYNTSLFDTATIDRMTGHFLNLLAGAAADPGTPISQLPLLPAAERHQVLVEWNDTAVAREEEHAAALIHEPFEAWARRTPDAVAAVWRGEMLTYGDLEERASRLARRLEHLGAGPGSLIGIHLRRGPGLIVAVLAVLKAGAAYVPLEIGHPPARLRFILDAMEISCVITETAQQDSLPELPHVIFLDRPEPVGSSGGIGPIRPITARRASPDDLAYIIFTSGTTGTPKGVMVRHRPVINLLRWAYRAFAFSPADRVLFVTSLSFDLSVFDIFGLLGAGGSIRIADEEEIREPERLLQALTEEPITFWDSAPAALEQTVPFLAGMDPQARPALRLVFLSGDWIPVTLPDRIRERFSGARVMALGGATEATVWSNVFPIERVEPSWTSIPYGRPIENARYHVLDAQFAPCPVGVPGDLYIGGDCLADGYAREPVLTAHKFLPDPWSATPGGRLYRTGDRARYRPDGNLEFLGRLDHQVKIRGFRIELGEIETALATLPGVREAAVVVREDRSEAGGRDRRLVAYVAGDAAADTLRQSLRERLPDYMVPAAFVTLAALPLTPNGKVDRKALPAPEQPSARESYVAPRTREEELLVAVWAQVLRLPRVGVNENFFELGGDSILSVQIVARARQAGLLVTVRQIFEHQTVAELAHHAAAADTAGAARAEQGPVAGEVPLTPIQRWFFEQGFADLHHFNQALLLESREPLAPASLERAMGAVVEHHDALRLRFNFQDRDGATDGWRQENAVTEPTAPFHRIDLSSLPAPRFREALESAITALHPGFDLSAGPLTRLSLFEAGAEQPRLLLWVTHHLVVDGVSWRVLLEDLEGAYRQAARGLRPAFPPKTTSFQEWARRLAGYAGSDTLARELEDWLEVARASVPRLPVDFPIGGENTVAAEASISFELTVEETSDLLQTVPSVYHNRIDEALLSALARALADWTGSPRLRVNLEGHGREPLFNDLDISRTVGWFTSLYPVVLEAGDAGPGAALVSAKERLRAVPERGIGYGLLRYLGDAETERLLVAAPAAEISFNYLGQLDGTSDELSLFRASMASAGPTRSPRAHRTHLLEIDGMVANGQLRFTLVYGSRMHRRETIERLAAAYAGALRQLIQHSREREDEVFTASDFPKAGFDARSFSKLASLLPGPTESIAEGMGLTLKNVEDIYPLSPVQNGMLFHSLMEPESGVYVNQVTCTFPPDLDSRLFRKAWERLAERHGVLRTAFLWDGLDEARQVVHESCALPWQDLDWRGLSADQQQRRFEELRHLDRHTPLPLSQAPLMRFSLIRLDRELGFIWTFHHLLMDGWSLPVLVQELGSVYTALQEGREPALPPVRPFSDYIVWLQKQDLSRTEPFWRGELAGFTTPNQLGIDRPAGVEGASGRAEHSIRVSREVTAELQTLAARHKLTVQTVTQGAWAVLISRYGSEEDVVFGGVVSGRPAALPGVETMIGMFVNTLPVRVRVNDAEPLAPWLQRLQERQLARQEFEHTPLTQIQRWSEVPSGSPLFETLYVFENYPTTGNGSPGGLRIGNLRSFEDTNYPITLILTVADQISLQLAYDRTRVDDDVAPRLLHHLATLLAGMAEGAERRLRDLPLLDEEEHRQVVLACNATARARAEEELSLYALFERQVALTPEAPAVVGDDGVVSYGELAGWAGRIAERLRRLGIGAENRVGVCLERSAAALAALLGTLRAGAAYVPLDPEWPRERLAAVAADAGLAALLIRSDLAAASGLAPWEVPVEEARRGAPAELPRMWPVTPEAAAYVIYTSGSSGAPKGVVTSHRAAANFVLALGETLDLAPGDRLLLFAPLSFDASVLQIFPALSRGAAVVVHPDPRELAGAGLPSFCERHGVTVLDLPAALWRQWIEDMATAGQALPVGIRAFLTGGESVPAARVRAWAGLTRRSAAFLSSYGPTEATVTATVFLTDSVTALSLPEGKVPIGNPLANVRAYVLDTRMQPVPTGVAGELYLAGDGLARGYLGQPGLTAASFVPDPASDAPGGRLYRTGDLARRLPGGTLEFLGRADTQVKIRGFRLELSEVEAALRRHPDLAECVVTLREDRPNDRRLVAYVVPQPGRSPGVPELRSFVAERLPQYMVPSAVVTLSTLPVLASGKVDRAALPAPEHQRAEETWLAPRTPVEEILAGIWAELLGVQQAGSTDHFFDLGGHSLLATQARSKVREAFGVELPLRTLFELPVLADLAAEIEALRSADGAPRRMTIERADRQGPLPLSLNQQRFWFLQQLNPASSAFNLSSAVRLSGRLDGAALEASFGEIVRRHSVLRTRIVTVAGVPYQIVDPPGSFTLSRVDLSGLGASVRNGELRRVAQSAAQRPFDLAAEPPLQVLLLRLADDDHAVLFSLHHIAGDGWSMDILTRELGDLYTARIEGRPSPLSELPIQYADWVVAQQEWLRGPGGAEQLAYWRRQLGGDLPVLTFPMQRQRPAVRRFRGAAQPLILDASLSAALADLARSTGSTLFMSLLAALKALLHLVTGAEDLLVGTNVANREEPGTEGLIGLFVNDLALRTDLSGRPSFRELLVRVRETALEAYAHQDLPFEALQTDLRAERSAGPLFQVLFVLQNASVGGRKLPGLTLSPVAAEGRTANFDLTLNLTEGANGIQGAFVYDVDLFEASTIARLAEHFVALLREVASDPDRPLPSLSFATPAAAREMVESFSEDL